MKGSYWQTPFSSWSFVPRFPELVWELLCLVCWQCHSTYSLASSFTMHNFRGLARRIAASWLPGIEEEWGRRDATLNIQHPHTSTSPWRWPLTVSCQCRLLAHTLQASVRLPWRLQRIHHKIFIFSSRVLLPLCRPLHKLVSAVLLYLLCQCVGLCADLRRWRSIIDVLLLGPAFDLQKMTRDQSQQMLIST